MLLNGSELAGYIKERQARAVRQLAAKKLWPTLAVVSVGANPVSAIYMKVKQRYGEDIGAAVRIYEVTATNLRATIKRLNGDLAIHGVIVQLPLPAGVDIDEVLALIEPDKDVDDLGGSGRWPAPTPTAILWLLAGYNIELAHKKLVVVGEGRLVGAPLAKLLKNMKLDFTVLNDRAKELDSALKLADVIISATGVAGLIKNDAVKRGAVLIDAGAASENGKVVGDANTRLYRRKDIKISPTPGGVGPLTVCALFENVISATASVKAELKRG